MKRPNPSFRELFTLPPITSSADTEIIVPQIPPAGKITGDREIDAVLWLQSLVKTGNQAYIDKAMEAVKRIQTPMAELARRYTEYLYKSSGGHFGALFASFGFGDLEDQAKKATQRARDRHEALARFGTAEMLFADTPAEKLCKKALRGIKRNDCDLYDETAARDRFEQVGDLMPSSLSDCLYARAYWDRLYWLRLAVGDVGDSLPQAYAHERYCRDMLAHIPARSADEAMSAFEHIKDDKGVDRESIQPILRNLIESAWTAASPPNAPHSLTVAQGDERPTLTSLRGIAAGALAGISSTEAVEQARDEWIAQVDEPSGNPGELARADDSRGPYADADTMVRDILGTRSARLHVAIATVELERWVNWALTPEGRHLPPGRYALFCEAPIDRHAASKESE